MKFVSHFNTATGIVQRYKGNEPFAHFIKTFFKQYKKYGSTDRKAISHLCYCYFRLGHALKNIGVEEKILIGVFLCNQIGNELLHHFRPEWNANIHMPVEEKLSFINYPFRVSDIFPWEEELSEGINHAEFCKSFLIQPDLFLRIRPGKKQAVLKKLFNAKIKFHEIDDSCIVLANSTRLDGIIDINDEAVIQDYNSQKISIFFQHPNTNYQPHTAWDCCAASGGKSIMLYDIYPAIKITVSDVRESILLNLKKRFSQAGIKSYDSFISDLNISNGKQKTANYDLIIADVPCSGSGTWGRTPESLLFFRSNEIERYSYRQKKIINNIIPVLNKKGRLIYITCSVFKKENEEVINYIKQEFSLKLEKMELLKGYDTKADTLFAASFVKL